MESESDPQSEVPPMAVQPVESQWVAIPREERETRWRLELAETRAHPFQLAKFFQAAPSVSPKECAASRHRGSVLFRSAAAESFGAL